MKLTSVFVIATLFVASWAVKTDMQSHMDDAGAHHGPGPEGPDGPPPGADMDGDGMAPPPPPDDPSDDVV